MLNNSISPIEDIEISEFLKSKKLNLVATLDKRKAIKNATFTIVAVPTNYDSDTNYFDTKIL